MKKEWEDIITEALNVNPIEISSAKFVPQARKRLYWTNIPNVGQPEQKHYNISDFLKRCLKNPPKPALGAFLIQCFHKG